MKIGTPVVSLVLTFLPSLSPLLAQTVATSTLLFEGTPNDSVTCDSHEYTGHNESIQVKKVVNEETIKYEIYQDGERVEVCKSKPTFNVFQYEEAFVNLSQLSKISDNHLFTLALTTKIGHCELRNISPEDYSIVALKMGNTQKRKTLATFNDVAALLPKSEWTNHRVYSVIIPSTYLYDVEIQTLARDALEAEATVIAARTKSKERLPTPGKTKFLNQYKEEGEADLNHNGLIPAATQKLITDKLRDLIAQNKCGVISQDTQENHLQADLTTLRQFPEYLLTKRVPLTRLEASNHTANLTLLPNGYTAKVMKDLGYEIDELAQLGYSALDLIKVGATLEDLKTSELLSDNVEIGLALKTLRNASFEKLLSAGFTLETLAQIGFTKEAIEGGLSIDEYLKLDANNSPTLAALVTAGYTEAQVVAYRLDTARHSSNKVLALALLTDEIGLEKVKALGTEKLIASYTRPVAATVYGTESDLARKLIAEGKKVQDLLTMGFSRQLLLGLKIYTLDVLYPTGKFTAEELQTHFGLDAFLAVYPCDKLQAKDVKNVGVLANAGKCTTDQLMAFATKHLDVRSGYLERTLKTNLGLTKETIKRLFPTPQSLLRGAVNSSLRALIDEWREYYTTRELVEYGFSVTDLQNASQGEPSITTLLAWGYTPEDLTSIAKWSVHELVKAGISVKRLRAETSHGTEDYRLVTSLISSSSSTALIEQLLDAGYGKEYILAAHKASGYQGSWVRERFRELKEKKYKEERIPNETTPVTPNLVRSGKKLTK